MKIRCTHCGADVPIEETTAFVKCPYCSAALIAQIRCGIEHRIMQPLLDRSAQISCLRRVLSREEVSDPPEIISAEMTCFPYWRFSRSSGRARLIAAAEMPSQQMTHWLCPDGNLQYFPEENPSGTKVIEPTVLLDEARAWAERLNMTPSQKPEDVCLLHLPIVCVTYECQAQRYQAWIDACGGEVFADFRPSSVGRKKGAAFAAAAAITFTVFAMEAWLLHPAWLLVAYPLSAAAVYAGIAAMLQRFGW